MSNKTQKCPPEICPDGDCGRNKRWHVKTHKCMVKPYEYWTIKDGHRQIPADVKDMVGPEVYKTEYQDRVGKPDKKGVIGLPIREIPVPKNVKIQIFPKPAPVMAPKPEPEPEPGIVVVRKPKKISISSKPLIIGKKDDTPLEKEEVPPRENTYQAPVEEKEEEEENQDQVPIEEKEEEEEEENQDQVPIEEKKELPEENKDDEEPDDEPDEESFIDDDDHYFLYPRLDDPKFSLKIAKRKEFNDTQYDGSIEDIRKQAEKLCSADFELMPHQSFVKNFMSFQTPYNSLLLYHGLGTGKTCSAIGIAEEMRNYMKQIGLKKSIMIIASPNVQDNFILQLFDERKLDLVDGIWTINSCVGNSLLKEINPTDAKGVESDRVSIISQIKALIKQYYVFMGYTAFANFISESIDVKGHDDDEDEKLRIQKNRIKNLFDNRLIIIDEVHNIKTIKMRDNKPADLLAKIARNTDNMRLLLLSATPMYNSHEEIIWLCNLMNINDKRKTIKVSDVFGKDGKFNPNGGKELLRKKLNGYVSYVRGENPYTFPYRIYPEIDENTKYPTIQMNKKPIDADKAFQKFVPIYVNGIGEYQSKVYNMCVENLGGDENVIDIENKDSFGYTLLQKPLEALIIVYPSKDYDPTASYTVEEKTRILLNMIGKTGLSNVMQNKDKVTDKQYNYQYKVGSPRIFSSEELPKYSAKIANVCEIVKKSKGIILIYTQYIDGGAVPVALALEEMGFSRYGSDKSLFKTPPSPAIDSMTMQPMQDGSSPARYVMITGDASYSPNNDEDIKYLNSDENKDGKLVKVVIISKAAGEGIDFKNIRQVHILEPWYNMNRMEQIIGRGVRNLSHCKLKFEDRNVEIFLHATLLGTEEESADMYVYRLAERKAIAIGEVTRVLKEVAVDCFLNIGQTNFTTEQLYKIVENKTIKLALSSGREIDYKIGDKPRTNMCDYMADCAFKCYPNADAPTQADITLDTYGIEFVEENNMRIVQRIRELFKKRHFYNGDEIIEAVNTVHKYSDDQIYSSLTRMIESSNEYVVDEYGRLGHVVNNGNVYLFQPVEITDKSASLYERIAPVEFKHKNVSIELHKRKPGISVLNGFEQILVNLTSHFNDVFTPNKSSDSWWYSELESIRPHLLKEYRITDARLHKHVVYHMLDNMILPDKIIILNNIYNGVWKPSSDKIEPLIKQYFDDRVITAEGGDIGICLTPDNKSTRIYAQSGKGWAEAPHVERVNITRAKEFNKKYVFNKQLFSNVLGFTSWFENGTRIRNYVFKAKYLSAAKNTVGRVISNALKEYTLPILNEVVGEPNKYNTISLKEYKVNSSRKISVLLEILMREFNDTKKEYVLYLNNEQAIINKA